MSPNYEVFQMVLTDEQKQWWLRLLTLIALHQGQEHLAIRQLAMEIISAQPYQDKIVVQDQVLIRFPNAQFKNKQDYIRYHSQPGTWAEDAILFPVLSVLGYQPVMHLVGVNIPPYLPFEQRNKELTIHIENFGAAKGGYHWELQGRRNAGGGNCGYHTVAQAVLRDIPKITPKLPKPVLNAIAQQQQPTQPQKTVAQEVDLVQIETKWREFIAKEEVRLQDAKARLSLMSTQKLIELYRHMVPNSSYLKNRMEKYAPQENGLPHDFFKNILTTGVVDQTSEVILREELIHAMGREAWIRPEAYELVKNPPNSRPIAFFAIEDHAQAKTTDTQPTVRRHSIS